MCTDKHGNSWDEDSRLKQVPCPLFSFISTSNCASASECNVALGQYCTYFIRMHSMFWITRCILCTGMMSGFLNCTLSHKIPGPSVQFIFYCSHSSRQLLLLWCNGYLYQRTGQYSQQYEGMVTCVLYMQWILLYPWY